MKFTEAKLDEAFTLLLDYENFPNTLFKQLISNI